MLSFKEFTQMSYQDKKEMLIMLCGQLDTPQNSFENVILLLNASNKIKESTLDSIYIDLEKLMLTAKNQWYMEQQSQSMQKKIQHDITMEQEHKDADKLLDTI